MKNEKSKIKSSILLRVRVLYMLFILTGLVVFIRLIWVQMLSEEVAYNAERLEGRIFTEQTISAQRGSILARNGEPLATSIFRYQVKFDFASPGFDSLRMFREQTDSLAKLLSAFFGDKSAAEYQKMFREEHSKRLTIKFRKDTLVLRSEGFFSRWIDRFKGQEFKPVKLYDTIRDHTPIAVFPREVDYAEWQTLSKYPILNWNLGMVYNTEQTDQRIYPQGELARRTIGLIGDQGNYGIETVYKTELSGRDGKARRQRIARGFYGRVVGSGNIDPQDGMDIVTTLDPELQDVADKMLRQQLEAQNAIWGTTIVMEVSTGEILAMANLGRNPNGTYTERENYALSHKTEPGSTFKLSTMLTLLEDAQIPMHETYDTENGQVATVGGVKVQDSHRGHNNMDFKLAVAQSSNVYFAKAIWRHYANDKERYSNFLRHLHLDKTVGLEAFGEKKPTFQEWAKVPDPNSMLVRRSFGYRIELAPIQMITLYNAVANGGHMIAPVLIKELRRNGETVAKYKATTLVDTICSPGTLRKVKDCLREVCRTGTAAGFFRDSTKLLAAAKTGTAQYASGRIKYGDGYYVGSMAAFFPADNPRYTILTTIHTKRQAGKAYYGGPLSGPVVKAVATYINNRNNGRGTSILSADGAKHYPNRIKGGDMAQMRKIADMFSPHVAFEKRDGWGRADADTLSNIRITESAADSDIMPDVTGMGLKDALFLLESRGLNVSFSGKGSVEMQSIQPGDTVGRGCTVNITLK